MTGKVPRYFWGETPEFSYAFNAGAGGIFVGKPTFDDGAGEYVVPVAVPVVTGRQAIGTINLHLFAER